MSPADIQRAAVKLVERYDQDLDSCQGNELVQLEDFCKSNQYVNFMNDEQGIEHEQLLYSLIVEKRLTDTFPNVEITLRMYLVLSISNSSSQGSFSKFKLINNRLETTMILERLSALIL